MQLYVIPKKVQEGVDQIQVAGKILQLLMRLLLCLSKSFWQCLFVSVTVSARMARCHATVVAQDRIFVAGSHTRCWQALLHTMTRHSVRIQREAHTKILTEFLSGKGSIIICLNGRLEFEVLKRIGNDYENLICEGYMVG